MVAKAGILAFTKARQINILGDSLYSVKYFHQKNEPHIHGPSRIKDQTSIKMIVRNSRARHIKVERVSYMLNHVYSTNVTIWEWRKEGGGLQSYKKHDFLTFSWQIFFSLKGIIQGLRKICNLTNFTSRSKKNLSIKLNAAMGCLTGVPCIFFSVFLFLLSLFEVDDNLQKYSKLFYLNAISWAFHLKKIRQVPSDNRQIMR